MRCIAQSIQSITLQIACKGHTIAKSDKPTTCKGVANVSFLHWGMHASIHACNYPVSPATLRNANCVSVFPLMFMHGHCIDCRSMCHAARLCIHALGLQAHTAVDRVLRRPVNDCMKGSTPARHTGFPLACRVENFSGCHTA
eukprot:351900-Chlamydomonas_euryale.AAC.4